MATLTTVGYGDIYPVTVLGRILGAVIAFSGIAALAIPTGIITAGLTERIGRSKAVDDELARQREKDADHGRLIRELEDLIREVVSNKNNK